MKVTSITTQIWGDGCVRIPKPDNTSVGVREEMQKFADERNAAEGLLTGGKLPRSIK